MPSGTTSALAKGNGVNPWSFQISMVCGPQRYSRPDHAMGRVKPSGLDSAVPNESALTDVEFRSVAKALPSPVVNTPKPSMLHVPLMAGRSASGHAFFTLVGVNTAILPSGSTNHLSGVGALLRAKKPFLVPLRLPTLSEAAPA